MKYTSKLLVLLFTVSLITKRIHSQCNLGLITIEKCDMENIDFDGVNGPDGIINLYNETGTTLADGTWRIDPRFRSAFDEATGNLSTWALKRATTVATQNDYFFELMNAATCGTDPVRTARLILGPFSGVALPPSGPNNVNAQGCDFDGFDLFSAFALDSNTPSPHLNGEWTYNGSSPNFGGINGSVLLVDIPYQPGVPLVDQEVFELTYTVFGVSGCIAEQTTVRVAMVRQVDSGESEPTHICEDDLLAGVYDADIDLTNDLYLLGEDIEGIWLPEPTGQIENSQDSMVNLRAIYDNLISGNNLRFGREQFDFVYSVEQRSAVCDDKTTKVSFVLYEQLRPFNQKDPPFQICNNIPGTIDLYDLLEFTTENGIPFEYFSDRSTNWRLVSGASDLGLHVLSPPDPLKPYTHRGTVNTFGADPGTYIFEYAVSPNINSDPSSFCDPYETDVMADFYCEHPCNIMTARVEVQIFGFDYAGEDTKDINLCESQGQVDLRSLLRTNGNTIATTGVWTNTAGDVIDNTFVFPNSSTSQTFTFTYSTNTVNGCVDSADLIFTINKLSNAGEDASATLCSDDLTITLFDLLGGNPSTTGTWAGPFGYTSPDHLGVFDSSNVLLPVLGAGDYIYVVPGNAGCSASDQSTVTITIVEPVEIGNDRSETFCKIDGRVNLYSLLDRDTPRTGVFEDTDNTGALSVDGVVEFETLTNNIYNFRYIIANTLPCDQSSLNVAIQIVDLPIPNVPPQEFCILDAARLEDIEVDVLNYNWYTTLESEIPIIDNPLLFDNQVYYIAAIDANNCESERLEVPINILNTGERFANGELCTLDFQDGVSPNGDSQNDTFDLLIEEVYNIPEAFPDFDLKIYNRYGSLVYEGNINTEEFRGESNVSVQLGDDLPSGTYFYVFVPNFENNLPIQGSFYLSR